MNKEEQKMLSDMYIAIEKIENCKEFSKLIPEVRSNLVYRKENSKNENDVLGIDGRITVVNHYPKASGKPKFGASSHMARLIVEVSKYDPSIRAGIDFASSPEIVSFLEEYCRKKNWIFSVINRVNEPEEVKLKEGASMPWKVAEAVRAAGGKVPKIFYETGAIGKEAVSVLIGSNPIEVVEEMCEIARTYCGGLRLDKVGKIDFETFESFIAANLGKYDSSIVVPPLTGVDAGVIDIGNNKVLIIAEDPIFPMPKQPLETFGWYTVHIGASDVAVMGVKPQFMTYTLLMPPSTCDADFKSIVSSIHKTAQELGIAIVGGHTGYYPTVVSPIIGGITVFSVAEKGSFVTAKGAKPGDDVILTKGPAIEASGILAIMYEEELLRKYSADEVSSAKSLCSQMTVVKDALVAMECGGVNAMHDATEGGVLGGLFEVANASNVGMEVDENLMIYPKEVEMVCDTLDIDPIKAISEGSLILTCDPKSSNKIIENLRQNNINASIIGKVLEDKNKRIMHRRDATTVSLEIPKQDPFWPVFFKALK